MKTKETLNELSDDKLKEVIGGENLDQDGCLNNDDKIWLSEKNQDTDTGAWYGIDNPLTSEENERLFKPGSKFWIRSPKNNEDQ